MNETLTWSEPIETEKIRTHHAKIVVECITGKPYYSIEWLDTTKNEYYLGYSSYNIDNVLGWLSEFFEIVKAPKTNADRIRAMSDEELAEFLEAEDWLCSTYNCCSACPMKGEGTKCLSVLQWLKQPAEVTDNEKA